MRLTFSELTVGKHHEFVAWNKNDSTTNYIRHLKKYHLRAWDAVEHAQEEGEDPTKTLRTMLQKHSKRGGQK